ncbi:MAG: hypothetical protein JXA92_02585 [candidate division Zixibacteria bacterium]|nr:hypothetical protein [candidate division Zixibacteria bacterium]
MKRPILPFLCLITVLIIGFISCSDSSSPSSSNKPKPTVYELLATDEGDITIAIKAGQIIEITTTDSVNSNPDGLVVDCDLWTDADGIPDCQYVTSEPNCRNLPFMALIGTLDSDYFLVGTSYCDTFTTDDTLTLCINDWVFYDNDGKFTISVLKK